MAVSARRQVGRAQSISNKKDFEANRNRINQSVNCQTNRVKIGEAILENKLSISKDEQQYYSNHKVFTNTSRMPGGNQSLSYSQKPLENFKNLENSGAEYNRYSFNTPSYFRMLDNPNYRNIQHKNGLGQPQNMMQIVSKNQGWITVNPQKVDRKNPLEKERLGDVTKANELSPAWM